MCHRTHGLWKLPRYLPSLWLETTLKALISQLDVHASHSSPWLSSSACLAQTLWPNHPPTHPVSPPAPEGVASAVSMG